ncbi:MAG: hypothetical protein QOH31_6907, partial [Verrucomicrobiota bacterium]
NRMPYSQIWWRVAATAVLLLLCVLSTVRRASGAFEAEGIPIANLIPPARRKYGSSFCKAGIHNAGAERRRGNAA